MAVSDKLARVAARFLYKVINEIAAMEKDEPEGEHVVLGLADERTRGFGFDGVYRHADPPNVSS